MRGLALVLALLPGFAAAETLDGALDLWLEGREEVALPMLDGLAEAGDPTAALVLAMIERRAPSIFVAGLDAEARRTIFRAEGGKFGKPWIAVAKSGPRGALAEALWPQVTPSDLAPLVELLLAEGESGHAAAALMTFSNMDPAGVAELAVRADLPEGTDWLVWSAAVWAKQGIAETPAVTKLIAEAAAAPDSLDRRLFLRLGGEREPGLEGTEDDRALNRLLLNGEIIADPAPASVATRMEPILMAAPQLAGIRKLCEARCAEGPPACLRAVYSMIGGIAALRDLSTPLETVISQAGYVASPRYLADVAVLARAEPRGRIAPAPGAACAVAMLAG